MKKKNVTLLISVSSHINLVLSVAELLVSSGRFLPVILFCSKSCYMECKHKLANSTCSILVWNYDFFLPADEIENSNINLHHYGKKNLYLRYSQMLREASSLLQILGFTIAYIFKYIYCFGHYEKSISRNVSQSLVQRVLLLYFDFKWKSMLSHPRTGSNGFFGKIVRMIDEGILKGISEQSKMTRAFDDFLENMRINLILMPESNLFYNSHLFIQLGHRHKIPVAVVPYTIPNVLEWAEAFVNKVSFRADKGMNRAIATAFPHWVLEYKDRRLILPSVHVLGCEYFDIVPPIPWLINSGDSDAIAAESHFMFEHYLHAGVQKEKIHFTGALSDDKIFILLKERDLHLRELAERLDFKIREKVILIGLPPDQFGGGKRQGCEFNTYEELIHFMVSTVISLSGSKATVLINLHPRIKHDDVIWLLTLGAKIIDQPIESLVPLADIYIAVSSATIRLGISSGIPVINYDAYQYNYDDYTGLAGVCEVKFKHDYENILVALINEPLFYLEIQKAQEATAKSLCSVDGKAGERMLNLFDYLTSSNEVK